MTETLVQESTQENTGVEAEKKEIGLIDEELTVVGRNLWQKLLAVRKRVPYLQKQQVGHQYNFVGSSTVLAALRDELDKQGLLLFPHVLDKELSVVSVTNKDKYGNDKVKSTYFTELRMEFEWVDADTGESKKVPFYSQGIDYDGEKGVGKALTYAEKYFLLKQFNIPTDQLDPDSFQQMTGDLKPNYITNEQVTELSKIVMEISALRQSTADTVIQTLGVNTLEKIEVNKFLEVRAYLTGWLGTLQAEQAQLQAQQQFQQQPQQPTFEQNYPQQEQQMFSTAPYYEQPQQPVQTAPSYEEPSYQQYDQQPQTNLLTFNGELVFVTPPSSSNGTPQIACTINGQNEQLNLLVQGLQNVQAFEQVQTGQVIKFQYDTEIGVPVFKGFI